MPFAFYIATNALMRSRGRNNQAMFNAKGKSRRKPLHSLSRPGDNITMGLRICCLLPLNFEKAAIAVYKTRFFSSYHHVIFEYSDKLLSFSSTLPKIVKMLDFVSSCLVSNFRFFVKLSSWLIF